MGGLAARHDGGRHRADGASARRNGPSRSTCRSRTTFRRCKRPTPPRGYAGGARTASRRCSSSSRSTSSTGWSRTSSRACCHSCRTSSTSATQPRERSPRRWRSPAARHVARRLPRRPHEPITTAGDRRRVVVGVHAGIRARHHVRDVLRHPRGARHGGEHRQPAARRASSPTSTRRARVLGSSRCIRAGGYIGLSLGIALGGVLGAGLRLAGARSS